MDAVAAGERCFEWAFGVRRAGGLEISAAGTRYLVTGTHSKLLVAGTRCQKACTRKEAVGKG